MKLRRLRAVHVPGLEPGLDLSFGPGLNVIVGRNGSGKSTIARLVRESIWPPARAVRGDADLCWEDASGDEVEHRLRQNAPRLPYAGDLPDLPHCYVLRAADLLGELHGDDLVSVVRREIAGGLDIPSLRRDPITLDGRRKEVRELARAEGELHRREGEQRALAADEERLGRLGAQRDAAAAAGRRIPRLQARLRWLADAHERAELAERVAALPAVVHRMTGDEAGTAAGLRDQLDETTDREAEERGRIASARERIGALGLGSAPLDDAVIGSAQELCLRLLELRRDARAAHRALEGHREALAGLGGDPELEPSADEADLRGLVHLYTEEVEATQAADALAARLRQLTRRGDRFADGELRVAEDVLARWLTGADAAALARRSVVPLVVPGALVLAGALGVWWGPPWWIAGVAGGVALLGVDLLLRRRLRAADARASVRGEFGELSVAPPAAWTAVAVRARLREVRDELARAHVTAHERAIASELEAELREAQQAREGCVRRRVAACARLGLEPDAQAPVAWLLRYDRLVARRRARAAVQQAQGELEALLQQAGEVEAKLERLLADAGRPALHDAEAARAAVDALDRDNRKLAAAVGEAAEARRAGDRLREDAARLRGELDDLFAGLGLEADDDAGLARLLAQREEALEIDAEMRELDGRMRGLDVEVGDDAALRAATREELEAQLATAEAEHAALAGVSEEIGGIQARVADAARGARVAEALARVEAAREEVAAGRDEALRRAARAFLLDLVERECSRTHRPKILARAADHFFAFTNKAYTLVFGGADEGFRARENATGALRALDELSDGTRVQLWLAARLAFVESQERGAPLPLFLDEVLSQADPERVDAVVRVLGQVVAGGRQVFYLTSDPADVPVIGAAASTVVDLDVARGAAGAGARRAALAARPAPAVPPPGDLDAEAYGELLGVAPPRPFMEPAELDLFFVLSDRLDLLHRLRVAGIARVGHWAAVVEAGAADDWAADRALIDARCRLAEAYLARWRRGRGRPLHMRDLAGTDLVSSTFWPRLERSLEAHAYRAEGLLDDLAARRIKGFRKTDELAEFCRREGYLDERPLAPDDIHAGLVAAFAAERRSGLLGDGFLRAFVARLGAVLAT